MSKRRSPRALYPNFSAKPTWQSGRPSDLPVEWSRLKRDIRKSNDALCGGQPESSTDEYRTSKEWLEQLDSGDQGIDYDALYKRYGVDKRDFNFYDTLAVAVYAGLEEFVNKGHARGDITDSMEKLALFGALDRISHMTAETFNLHEGKDFWRVVSDGVYSTLCMVLESKQVKTFGSSAMRFATLLAEEKAQE